MSGDQEWLGRALGPRWSLARLLDVLGSQGRMVVHGGVGFLVSPGWEGESRGGVFVACSNNTRDEHSRFRQTGALPFLIVLVSLFFGVSRMWVFLHDLIPPAFTAGECPAFISSFPLVGEGGLAARAGCVRELGREASACMDGGAALAC